MQLLTEISSSEALNSNEAEAINELCLEMDLEYFNLSNCIEIGYYNLCIQSTINDDIALICNKLTSLKVAYTSDTFEI